LEQLSQILQDATAAIESEYFLLPIHGAASVYRERVYCYELYHQIRLRWPTNVRYRLNGEVDKRAHPYFEMLDVAEPKPDLLVHEPGAGHNLAVMEVKTSTADASGIAKDLRTLSLFRSEFGYERAIYLIYGEPTDVLLERVRTASAEMKNHPSIELWLHPQVGRAGTVTLQLTGAEFR
jgi:hypothetical protein